jgi:hypothetical protein
VRRSVFTHTSDSIVFQRWVGVRLPACRPQTFKKKSFNAFSIGREAKNPQKSIPMSIIASLLICCLFYCSVSGVLTLMMPYYLIDDVSPVLDAFRHVKLEWAGYVIVIGAICGLTTRYNPLYTCLDISLDFGLFKCSWRNVPVAEDIVFGECLASVC